LLRRTERRGWVDHAWETPDPDEVEASLKLLVVRTGAFYDAWWHLSVDIDPREMLRLRAKQKIYLARYGRQSVLQWADVDVRELQQYFELLAELVRDENALTTVNER
jgi:hypothetical protein